MRDINIIYIYHLDISLCWPHMSLMGSNWRQSLWTPLPFLPPQKMTRSPTYSATAPARARDTSWWVSTMHTSFL